MGTNIMGSTPFAFAKAIQRLSNRILALEYTASQIPESASLELGSISYGSVVTQQAANVSNGIPLDRYSGVASWTTRTKHIARVDLGALQLVFLGHQTTGSTNPEVALDNSVDLKVSVETSAGKIIPVRWGASRTLTLNPSQVAVSDRIGVQLSQGDVFWLRIFQDKGAGTYTYSNTTIRGASESTGEGYSAGVDRADSGTISQADYVGFLPFAILGICRSQNRNAILCVGDSILRGTADFPESNGFAGRSFSLTNPAVWLAVGGETASQFTDASKTSARLGAASLATPIAAVCNYGTNDITGGASAATVQANLTTIWTLLSNMGCAVHQCTILPRPASTSDQWKTLAGQTVAANNSVRIAVNSWIRGLPSPLSGYIETSDPVESARDSGKWACPASASWTGNANADGTSLTTLTAAGSPGWTVNAFRGYALLNVTLGTSAQIRSNTASVLTLDGAFTWLSSHTLEIWPLFARDGIHPTAHGHAAIAASIGTPTLA